MNRTRSFLETAMLDQHCKAHATRVSAVLSLLLVTMLLFSMHAFGAEAQQKSFATPDEAVNALVVAAKANDLKALRAVLGNDPGDLSSGDAVADRALREQFVAAYDAKHALTAAGEAMTLTIGNDDFPFGFPLVKTGDRWRFDTAAGKDELLARRVGANELDAIKVMQAIVDAQREYASKDRNGDGVLDYAQKFASSPGKRDGLYWKTNAGEPPSPLGVLAAHAADEGYGKSEKGPTPYHGYVYKMLKGQTKSAESGELDYVVKRHAIGGFAVVAWPAKYGSSGIMTFIVNQDGKVYQSDLGPKSAEQASKMQRFDPGKGWSQVQAP
jgi:hypothetical protein